MKNSTYIWSTIVCCMTITIIYLGIQYQIANKMKNNIIKVVEEYNTKFIDVAVIENNRAYEFTQSGTLINGNDLVYDENNIQYKLIDVIGDVKFILRYSSFNCNTCIEEQIEKLKCYQDSLKLKNIILLVTYESNRQMGRYLKTNNISYKTYNMSMELAEQIIDIGSPYYFVIEKKNLRINKMFVPQKELSVLTDRYFRSVIFKYFRESL